MQRAKLDRIKSAIAQVSSCKTNDISLKLAPGSVVVMALMPKRSATKLTQIFESGKLKELAGAKLVDVEQTSGRHPCPSLRRSE
jgi:hypothetical protein